MLPEETPSEPEILPLAEPVFAEIPPDLPAPPPERDPFWGYKDLALVLGMLFASLVVIALAAAGATLIWPKLREDPTPLILPTNLAMYAFLLLIFKLDFASRYGRPVFSSLGWKLTDGRTMLYALVGGLALPFVISAIGNLLRTPKVSTPMDQIPNSIPLAVMAVILAPFFEELFFRGFLQPLLTRSLGIVFGVVLTSALFGGVHAIEYNFIWQYVVAIGLVGVALGTMRALTNSIVPGTIMHACFNGLQVVAFAVSKHK